MGAVRKLDGRPLVTTQEVAHMLGITDSLLREKLPQLQSDQGFPMQLPYQKRPKLFSRVAVERWLERATDMTMADIEDAECLGMTMAHLHVMGQARRQP